MGSTSAEQIACAAWATFSGAGCPEIRAFLRGWRRETADPSASLGMTKVGASTKFTANGVRRTADHSTPADHQWALSSLSPGSAALLLPPAIHFVDAPTFVIPSEAEGSAVLLLPTRH